MPGARATPHQRLLALLVDAGAAYYHIQPKRDTRDFELYLPLLLKLAVEDKQALVDDLMRRTRPFVRKPIRLDYMRISFYSVLNEERFEVALLSALGDLETYKRPFEFPATTVPRKAARFPTMTPRFRRGILAGRESASGLSLPGGSSGAHGTYQAARTKPGRKEEAARHCAPRVCTPVE